MRQLWASIGLAMACEACEGDIDLPADLASGTGMCRQCGIAFLVDAPYGSEQDSRSA